MGAGRRQKPGSSRATSPGPVTRRTVLGAGAVGAVGLALGACSGDDQSDEASSDATSANATTTTPLKTEDLPPVPDGLPGALFTIGVASGDPLPDSVMLWTRLVADPLDPTGGLPDAPVPVAWEVATDEGFTSVVASGSEVAEPGYAHSVHADATGLSPDTWYWYRFSVGDVRSEPARTRTMPADDVTPDRMQLAFASCQEFNSGSYAAYGAMAADELDLVVFLGDYIYERGGGLMEPKVPQRVTQTLADYRVQYAAYKRNPLLQKVHRQVPWVLTWDDHEVGNNYAGVTPQEPESPEGYEKRRAAAYQAYWEHMPLRTGPPEADGSLKVYRAVRVGTLAKFFVLDGRQYRSDQVCGDRLAVPADECAERLDEAGTMLGAEQEAWLAKGLADNDTIWTVIAQQTVMFPLVLGDLVVNLDQWDGYVAARERLFDSIIDADQDNVVVLSGDIHAAGASDLFAERGGERVPVAHELVTTSISSLSTIGELGPAAVSLVEQVAADAVYVNAEDHGYGRVTITPERWTTEFVIVANVETDNAPASVDATIELAAGSTELVRI
jgi:alkaline phosphatase D